MTYRVYCDCSLLYHSKLENLKIISPSVELEANKTGSFMFTIPADHPYYSLIHKLKSIITVYQDDYLLFRGRVLDDEIGWHNEKAVSCEGEMAFLLDSIMRPYDFNGSIAEYLALLLDSHNAQVDEEKRFVLGNVTVTDANDYIVRSNIDYTDTWTELNNKLLNNLGGYPVFEGKTYTGATPTTSTITKSGTASAVITITDSRGRTATFTKTWTVVAYTTPKITSFTVTRCLADGTENYEGTFIKAAFNYTIASVNSKNTNTYVIEYKPQSGTTWTALTNGTGYAVNTSIVSAKGLFDVDSSYDLRLSITDSFTTIRGLTEIPTAFTLLDFNASGRGLAFGKVSELTEGVEFALPTKFSHAETPNSPIYLQTGQDLDALLEPGFYAIPNSAVSATLINKPWTSTATGGVYVMVEGDGMGKVQIAHKLSKDEGEICERSYYQNAWGSWHRVHNGGGKILWTGGYYMTETHKITFTEPASKQPVGIVLVFSEYNDGAARNQTWSSHFVHKSLIADYPGTGNVFWMSTSNGAYVATKYLYIKDDGITGHANNGIVITGTAGVTLTNNRFVLRYVIGV